MTRGYNWRNTLSSFASISGILAGFCVTFIGIILRWPPIVDIKIYDQLTFGNLAVFFFGVAAAFFIAASEYFLHAKSLDVFDLTDEYRNWLIAGFPNKNWDTIWKENTNEMRKMESYGRHCYNLAVFMIFVGLFFVIAPYHFVIALVVSVLGVLLEYSQFR